MTLTEIRRILLKAGIENAAAEARLLAAHFTGMFPARLMALGEEDLTAPGLEAAVTRRSAREPLQYILGSWSFMGLEFSVSPDCLIPRSDTETLCEAALAVLPAGARVADLCTGSGCIGLSLAHYRPDITVIAVEIAEKTAALAEQNAARLGLSDRFFVRRGDVTENVFAKEEILDCIVANPPYITLDEMRSLEPELFFEPRIALTDEGDGLSVIRGVLRNAAYALSPQGTLFMEFGCSQGEAVLELARKAGFDGEILRDTGGNDRVLAARRASL